MNGIIESLVKRFRVKTSMAVILRNVVHHNWGWFSREDPRMHLQTVDENSLRGPSKAKVWLESKGKRTFELAEGSLSGSDLNRLQQRVDADREQIEVKWAVFMMKNEWLKAEIRGSDLILTAYPGSHNSFTRTIDLKKEYPGVDWVRSPVYVDLDETSGLIAVGTEKNKDDRTHIPADSVLWGNSKW